MQVFNTKKKKVLLASQRCIQCVLRLLDDPRAFDRGQLMQGEQGIEMSLVPSSQKSVSVVRKWFDEFYSIPMCYYCSISMHFTTKIHLF